MKKVLALLALSAAVAGFTGPAVASGPGHDGAPVAAAAQDATATAAPADQSAAADTSVAAAAPSDHATSAGGNGSANATNDPSVSAGSPDPASAAADNHPSPSTGAQP